mgnify:CR=1 FL=1
MFLHKIHAILLISSILIPQMDSLFSTSKAMNWISMHALLYNLFRWVLCTVQPHTHDSSPPSILHLPQWHVVLYEHKQTPLNSISVEPIGSFGILPHAHGNISFLFFKRHISYVTLLLSYVSIYVLYNLTKISSSNIRIEKWK